MCGQWSMSVFAVRSLVLLCTLTSQTSAVLPDNRQYSRHQPPPSALDNSPRGPVFISEPTSTITFANTKGVLIPCTAYGRPAPVMDWLREDGTTVDNKPGLLEVMANNSLYFHPFESDRLRADIHATSYRCKAANIAGTIISRVVTVKAVLVDKYKTYNVAVNNVYVTKGNTAVFKCLINPYFVRDYITVTQWTQSGKTVQNGGRFSVLATGELHVRHVREQDSYLRYSCVTRNVLTGEEKTSDPAELIVIEPVNSPPNIEDTQTSLNVKQGQAAELPCAASGDPMPEYIWSRNGKSVSIDGHRVVQRGGNLIVRDAGVRDSGMYVCTARNKQGVVTATTQLTVTAPISAFMEPSHQTIDAGQTAKFNCTVYGYPIKTIKWYKNGSPIRTDSRVTLSDSRSLVIRSVQRSDIGMYQCVVSNDAENAQGAAQLTLGVARPIFHSVFQDDYVRPGASVSLMCKASGNPTPVITWTLDDGMLPQVSQFSVGQFVTENGDVYSYVNISHVRVQDGGQYRCQATNQAGSVQHIGRLYVYGVPYIRPMQNVTAVAHDVLVIRCFVAGFPVKSITWSKGTLTLPRTHRQHVSKDGTLTVQNVQRSADEGRYSCKAVNVEDQGDTQHVYVHVMEPPKIDPFRFPKRKQGDRVSISCVVSSGDLPITISWKKDGKVIAPDLGVIIQKTDAYSSTLSIGDVSPAHNGNYTCIAGNAAASTNVTATLHVDVPPRWVVEPQDSFVVLNQNARMDCQTTGTPEPRVVWKRAKGDEPGDYREIRFDEQNKEARFVRLANGSLLIHRAGVQDHGYYLCHASNGIGEGLSKVVSLTVHVPARFQELEKNYTVLKGHDVTMECMAVGDRPLSVAWSFNRQPLNWERNPRLRVKYFNHIHGTGSQLSVTQAQREDSGFYVCNAQNKFGHHTMTVELTVQEVAEAPTNVNIDHSTSRSIRVIWDAPYDGNCPITNYILQYKNLSDPWQGRIKNVSTGGENTYAVIPNLHPYFSYNIRVIANNSIGLSEPSRALIVQTNEEKPSGPPLDVQVTALDSQSLKVTWDPPAGDKRNGKVKGYYVGFKKFNVSGPYMYITCPIDADFEAETILNKLQKFTKYAVHVQAYNIKGAGPRSKDINVLTLEDVPSQPPQGVQATALSPESIMVVWSPPPLFTLHGILQGYKVFYKPVRTDEDESDAYSVTSTKLSAVLYGLEKFTNYSVQVLAYTRRGEGVRSFSLYVTTQQDYPDRPADIKALAASASSIIVTWKPPLHPNGVITKYNLYMQDTSGPHNSKEKKIELLPTRLNFLVKNLRRNRRLSMRVSASTIVGEGDSTRVVTASPVERVAARLATFSSVIRSPWKHDVILPCKAIGDPSPTVSWRKGRGKQLKLNDRIKTFENGSLWLANVESADAGNYTCRAENMYGADEISVTLLVQVDRDVESPPHRPSLTTVATTTSSIQINWRSGSNGGSKIQGFVLYYKREHSDWHTIHMGSQNRTFTAGNLRCGTRYKFHMRAFNKVGNGIPSDTIEAKTNGTTPIMPPQSMLIQEVNSTYVRLNLRSWLNGGCPITSYSIKYQIWGHDIWETVNNNIDPLKLTYQVDLRPATWYIMVVTAYNDAGSTDSRLKFSTLTYSGSTIKPVYIVHRESLQFYERIEVMVPLFAIFTVTTVMAVWIILFCKRRYDKLNYKETSNIRRDLTAETSLMTDLDKRLNTEPDVPVREPPYTPEPGHQRNVNLLTSEEQEENGVNTRATTQNNSNGDNSGSAPSVDDEGNINPYAMFQYPQGMNRALPEVPHVQTMRPAASRSRDGTTDSAGAQQSTNRVTDPSSLPPPPPELLMLAPPTDYMRYQNQPSYQNQGVALCPRRFASADQIHQTPYSAHPVTQSYSSVPSGRYHLPKGDRQSVSTISSSHDEAQRTDHYDQARDSRGCNVVKLTQSPGQGLQRLQAAADEHPCEAERTSKRPKHIDVSSESTECDIYQSSRDTSRKSRGRHRGKHKGQVTNRKHARPSRGSGRSSDNDSSGSTGSEEIGYPFDGRPRDSQRSSTSEGYLSYQGDSNACTDSDTYGPYSSRRKAPPPPRPTPPVHHFDDRTPETPGTDESRPLVCALAKPALASPKEEEEAVRLLDSTGQAHQIYSEDTRISGQGSNLKPDNFSII